jgi:hypothetical protein
LAIGGLAAGALYAGWAFGGGRGLAAVAGVLALAWVAERVDASWRAEAALATAQADLARADGAFQTFRAEADAAATAARHRILAIEQARAEAHAALTARTAESAAEIARIKERIAAHVPHRRDCDYRQPVLDGVRDAHARAAQ